MVSVGMMRRCPTHSSSTSASLSGVIFSSASSSAFCWSQTWPRSAGKHTHWFYTSTGQLYIVHAVLC